MRMTKDYQNAEPVKVRLMDDRGIVAKVQGADPQIDLAVISIDAQPVVACGTPKDQDVRTLQGSSGLDHRGIQELGAPCSESPQKSLTTW